MVAHDSLTPVPPPTGARFFLGTWSGRILLLNAAVFLVLSVQAGSLFMPDTSALLDLGAKDPVGLAHGEYWRLLTPVFIHIGLIHFAVNSYMLYVIGWQLERLLGGTWFLLVYLLSGIAGNVASAVFSVNLSAGASGALFGLLGAGFFLEHTIGRRIEQTTGQRPRNRAYAMTVMINLVLGLVIPFIDNAAHLGGLLAGVALTFVMVNLRPNSLQRPRRPVAVLALVALTAALGVGAYFGTSPTYLAGRLQAAGDAADKPGEQIFYYSQALAIFADDAALRLKRARLLFFDGDAKYAFHDLRVAMRHPELREDVEQLAKELAARGHANDAWQVQRLLEHAPRP